MEAIGVGVPGYEVALHSTRAMVRESGRSQPHVELMDTWTWFQSGINTDGAHNPVTSRRIERGDILSLNCFPMPAGYYTALERTPFAEACSEAHLRLWKINVEVHEAGIGLVRPGVRCCDIAAELNAICARHGLLENRTFGYGHSFGVLSHYYGRERGLELREDVTTVLEPNMVVSMEPMIMIPEGRARRGRLSRARHPGGDRGRRRGHHRVPVRTGAQHRSRLRRTSPRAVRKSAGGRPRSACRGHEQRTMTGAGGRTPMTDFPGSLLDGYRSFRGSRYESERARYRSLAEHGQSPEVMIIACCDSRSGPETIFNAAPGELFVVRNVANLVPPYEPDGRHQSTSAALEFAVQSLRVRHIVVLGHGRCGGIRAALHPEAEPLSPDDFIGKWMTLLGPAASEIAAGAGGTMTEAERQTALERVSVRNSVANLRTFPCVSILEDRNRLHLHGAWFDIADGELWTMEPATGEFSRLE